MKRTIRAVLLLVSAGLLLLGLSACVPPGYYPPPPGPGPRPVPMNWKYVCYVKNGQVRTVYRGVSTDRNVAKSRAWRNCKRAAGRGCAFSYCRRIPINAIAPGPGPRPIPPAQNRFWCKAKNNQAGGGIWGAKAPTMSSAKGRAMKRCRMSSRHPRSCFISSCGRRR